MNTRKFRKELLRSYYLLPNGIDSNGTYSYIPITKEVLEKLRHDSAFIESDIKSLETRAIN